LGVFAAEHAAEGDFVGEEVGEPISSKETDARGRSYDAKGISIFYSITTNVTLDAARLSNRMKFINHSIKRANLEPKLLNVCGFIRVGLFALHALAVGEEFFFDYGYKIPGWDE